MVFQQISFFLWSLFIAPPRRFQVRSTHHEEILFASLCGKLMFKFSVSFTLYFSDLYENTVSKLITFSGTFAHCLWEKPTNTHKVMSLRGSSINIVYHNLWMTTLRKISDCKTGLAKINSAMCEVWKEQNNQYTKSTIGIAFWMAQHVWIFGPTILRFKA